jgi:hypothetical protein
MIALAEPVPVKPARRRSAKPAKQEDTSKVKATIHISAEAARRLGVYAVMTGSTNSGVVESLIMEHLRRFVVSDRAKSSDEVMPIVSAD